MRIPSSFTDDSLYRPRGARAAARPSNRRLLRLLLAMVLVIAVMRQAGNPRMYEVFFSPPPPQQDTAAPRPAGAAGRATPDEAAEPFVDTPVGRAAVERNVGPVPQRSPGADDDAEVALWYDRLVAALDEPTARELMHALARPRRAPGPAQRYGVPAELADSLNDAAAALGQAGDRGGDAIDWDAPRPRQLLQGALDRWAIARTDPAAIWKAADALAFYRLLEQPALPGLGRHGGSRPSVISLLQQPEVYLHRRVQVPGSVARAIARQAADNPFGISEYWELWIRPRDGSEHPLVFFTAEVPEEVARVGPDASLQDGPFAWFDGVYLKRLAYDSASGGQLAPALVGRLHPAASPGAEMDSPAPPSPAPSGWLLVAVSALLGVTAAMLIFYQTRKEARRLRALRRTTTAVAPSWAEPPGKPPDDQSGTDK